MAYPTITGSGPNRRTNLQNIHSGERSFQKDLNTTHSQVALMQTALTNNGYNTHRADGKFDNNTLNAVKAFQRANGLTDDGYFGRSSLLKLEQLIGGHLDPTLGGCTDSDTISVFSSGGTYLGQGTVIGGKLYCRKQPKPKYNSWGRFENGTVIAIYSCSASGWYETRWPVGGNNVGYVMSKFVSLNGGGNEPSITTYQFIPENTVTYALNHSDNSPSGTRCTKRNSSFPGIDGKNDCADFAHQCLCAGGIPMFNGWYYCFTNSNLPTNWSESKWNLTHSGLQKLLSKQWLESVSYNQIEPGCLIYSYDKNASPTPYKHVTIAVSGNVMVNGKHGCYVCGCTTNQHHVFKELKSSNCRCYRVKRTLNGDGTERSVFLPLDGNGGYVIG